MSDPRVLVLGGSGMLGHKLWQVLDERLEAHVTVRGDDATAAAGGLLDPARTLTGVSAERLETVERAVAAVRPDAVVNCIGIVKQLRAAHDPIASISVNSLFPHRLAELCGAAGARLIQISTDCVFSGRSGGYTEADIPDPVDLYGRSKLLGEVADGDCLTIRTSIIGRELSGASGLLEWFLAQEGSVRGFRRAIFSGRRGGYVESDVPDPVDLYGRSKLLGEVDDGASLTIRTSIIGRELSGVSGLLEWFLAQEGSVRGFRRAIFSGLTTRALARVLAAVVCEHRSLTGVFHVASQPISKFDLLCSVKKAYALSVDIVADEEVVIDRSLDGSAFERETGLRVPSWADMVAELVADETPYERLRS
ncbi:MAG: SDR family oxidoreductase [Actinomycetota bacterium]|nr:SDR family oxidoreductase [Actinomycetota bacterium]